VRQLESIAADPNRSQPDRTSARRGARRITQDLATSQGLRFTPEELNADANPLLERIEGWEWSNPKRSSHVAQSHIALSGVGSEGADFPAPFTVGAGKETGKAFDERRRENLALVATRPARKAPISNEVALAAAVKETAHGQTMLKAALLADHAHDDGGVPQVTASDHVSLKDAAGQYYNNSIGVLPQSDQPILIFLHELGHHIATHALGPDALERVKLAAKDTWTWELLIKQGHGLEYWTDPDEVFCRAYSQWVIMKTKDTEGLQQLQNLLSNPDTFFVQWPSSDFTGVGKAIEIELKALGWLK